MANFGFRDVPVVVKNIIIINILMVVLQLVLFPMGINLQNYLALHYFTGEHFHWWQFLTHIFMHGSPDPADLGETVGHIFFNMFGLYMFGSVIENRLGSQRFLLFYLICGMGAGLCYLGVNSLEYNAIYKEIMTFQQHPTLQGFSTFLSGHHLSASHQLITTWSADPNCVDCRNMALGGMMEYYHSLADVPMVGASGAVFGILFAFAYLFPDVELYIMFIPVPVKAKWAVAGYAAIELFSGIGRFRGDNIAHFAHLGGMLFAFILLRIWVRRRNNYY